MLRNTQSTVSCIRTLCDWYKQQKNILEISSIGGKYLHIHIGKRSYQEEICIHVFIKQSLLYLFRWFYLINTIRQCHIYIPHILKGNDQNSWMLCFQQNIRNNARLNLVNLCELLTMVVSEDTQNSVAGVVLSVSSGLSESSVSFFGCLWCSSQAHQVGMAGAFLCLLGWLLYVVAWWIIPSLLPRSD